MTHLRLLCFATALVIPYGLHCEEGLENDVLERALVKSLETTANECFAYSLQIAADYGSSLKETGIEKKKVDELVSSFALINYNTCLQIVALKLNQAATDMEPGQNTP